MATHRLRRMRLSDWTTTSLMKVSLAARTTALLLTLAADDHGRAELRTDLLLATLYPKRSDPITEDDLESHLLELDQAGFLTIYETDGQSMIALAEPPRVDRPTASEYPPPPVKPSPHVAREDSRKFVAVGGAGAEWAAWEDEQEREGRPERPLVMDAPPIGCPDHPDGRFKNCGPCGTARRRHDRWLATRSYEVKLAHYEAETGAWQGVHGDDDYGDEF